MAVAPLFIGVVSHPKTRFVASQGEHGLATQLAAQLPGAEVHVNVVDLLDEKSISIDRRFVQSSLTAEFKLEQAWMRYLKSRSGMRQFRRRLSRWVRRSAQWIRSPSPNSMRRLINIELSHRDLLERGLASGAPWMLILEDDAGAQDVFDLAQGIDGIIHAARPPEFVNLSQSFTLVELGIDQLVSPSPTAWHGAEARVILTADRPVTNTVCAIMYSREFTQRLMTIWQGMPMEPVVPIDWKLNAALMRMFDLGLVGGNSCWLVDPAPIIQMSMHEPGILPT